MYIKDASGTKIFIITTTARNAPENQFILMKFSKFYLILRRNKNIFGLTLFLTINYVCNNNSIPKAPVITTFFFCI